MLPMQIVLPKAMHVTNEVFMAPDKYWRIEDHSDGTVKGMRARLKELKYDVGMESRKNFLVMHMERAERGMLSVVGLSNAELRAVVNQRGLSDQIIGPVGTRAQLQDILLDEEDKFDRFLDLPPELRTRIYDHYFAEFSPSLHAPKQPPICLTNSLIRGESLPIFMNTFTFELNLLYCGHEYWRSGPSTHVKLRPDTRGWMNGLSVQNVADIRRIRLRLFDIHALGNGQELLETDIRHSVAEASFKFESQCCMVSFEKRLFIQRLGEWAAKIMSRPERWQLKCEDLFALRVAVERYVKDSDRVLLWFADAKLSSGSVYCRLDRTSPALPARAHSSTSRGKGYLAGARPT